MSKLVKLLKPACKRVKDKLLLTSIVVRLLFGTSKRVKLVKASIPVKSAIPIPSIINSVVACASASVISESPFKLIVLSLTKKFLKLHIVQKLLWMKWKIKLTF